MKPSIKKIFNNLNTYLFFVLFMAFAIILVTFEQKLSFEKINNLNNQKSTISTLTKLQKKDIELALIQFNGKSTYLHQEIAKLHNLYKYNFTDKYLFGNEKEYLNNLEKLSALTNAFNDAAHEYYVESDTENLEVEDLTKEKLDTAFFNLNKHIDTILLNNIAYDQKKFNTIEIFAVIYFIIVLLLTFWYRKRLYSIYKDIEFLHQIEKNQKVHNIFSIEADAIALKMNRKVVATDNPSMLDPVAGINNYKGMLNAYSQKKSHKDSNFTSVTVFEIDNFSKTKRAFSQEFTQTILKKIAYTISLYEQPVDVIARSDYNQFTLILSRASKEQSFKDADLIRQSISELKFNTQDKGNITITVSGGFVIKPSHTHLDEAIKQAKIILANAQKHGVNKIFQTRDMPETELK